MGLNAILEKKKDLILKKWFDIAINTYSLDTSRFLKTKKDQFANPVGSMLSNGLPMLFSELMSGLNQEKVVPALDPIVRVRAIQDFSPSNAVAFILSLKIIVREALHKDIKSSNGKLDKELLDFNRKVDELMLLAFDLYMACREKIYELKANEEKNKIYKAFRRAGLIEEVLDDGPNPMESNV